MKLMQEIQMYEAADVTFQEDREVALAGLSQDLIDDDLVFLKELLTPWEE